MALTFLQAVNKTLKRVGVVHGDAGELTNFVDTARQENIDITIDIWNDLIQQLYTLELFSKGTEVGQFILVADVREYDLEPDFEQMASEIIRNESSTWFLKPYPGGYLKMWEDQIDPSDFEGQPLSWAINTSTNLIRVSSTPTANQSGDIYKYLYHKRLSLEGTGDTFPFSDTVVDSLVGATAEMYRRDRDKEFSQSLLRLSFNRAISYLTQARPKTTYGRHA